MKTNWLVTPTALWTINERLRPGDPPVIKEPVACVRRGMADINQHAHYSVGALMSLILFVQRKIGRAHV